jgi:LemA protein
MWWILALLAVIAGVLIVSYNLLVRDHHRVLSAWSDIEVQLKRRHDLIPRLVEVVRQYAAYEQAALGTLTELRSQARQGHPPAEQGALEQRISLSLFNVRAVAEAYPDLKSNRNYLELMQQLTEIERDIQFARRYYNGAVNNLNTRIDTFPDLIVARLLRFRPAEYFDFEEQPGS